MPQLAKQHRHELLPASEAARVPLRLVLPYPGFKLQPREPLQNLTEYAAYSLHGRASCCPLFRFSLNPIQRYQNPCLSLPPFAAAAFSSIHTFTKSNLHRRGLGWLSKENCGLRWHNLNPLNDGGM